MSFRIPRHLAWEPSTTAGSSREKYGKTMEKKEKVLAAADPGCGRVPVNKIIPFSAVDGPGNRTAGAVWENVRKEPCLRMKTAKYGSVRKNAVAAIPVSMSVPLAAVPGSA